MERAIGVIELRSIAKGIESTDAMLKAADVFLIDSRPVCPGKYLIVVGGEVGSVENSVQAGEQVGSEYLVDSIVIPNVAEEVFPAINAATDVAKLEALAVVETFSLTGAILSADTMVKAAGVHLIEIRLAKGLGGKAFVLATGSVGDCKASIAAVNAEFKEKGLIIEEVVIPNPHPDLETVLF
ncbi:MAG: BMC domain-containing protein [Candidatus Wallbacteria bacterium]|nr:BMC domain-containing protein [Candidatus Wallbacteria bacterium]